MREQVEEAGAKRESAPALADVEVFLHRQRRQQEAAEEQAGQAR